LEKKKIFNKKERRFLGLKKLEENKSKNSKKRKNEYARRLLNDKEFAETEKVKDLYN